MCGKFLTSLLYELSFVNEVKEDFVLEILNDIIEQVFIIYILYRY